VIHIDADVTNKRTALLLELETLRSSMRRIQLKIDQVNIKLLDLEEDDMDLFNTSGDRNPS
jgi:hypothetical protein